MSRRALPRVVLLGLFLAYWALSLRHLTSVPPVYEDEPWQASTGWKLATDGVFGSDLFAGFYGMERRYYGYMPIHPLLLAVVFRVAGLGLFQARFEPVVLGLLTLALTYRLGRRLFHDERVALLAVVFLLAVRLTGLTYIQRTGILLFDMARIARYDIVVPVLGLAALDVYLTARARGTARWFLLAGVLAGLAGLAHLYGAFWLPALMLLALWDRRPWRDLAALPAGFVLPWLPYAAYVLGDLYDWTGQTRGYGNRFDLLNGQWYLENLLQEPHRYGPGLGALGPAVLLRVGFWSALVALPLALGALAWRAWRRDDASARALVVPLVVFPALFALLLRLKLVNYAVAFVPLAALAAAWGGVMLWDVLGRTGRMQRVAWMRWGLAALLAALLVEGATRFVALEAEAAQTTPYYAYIARVRAYLPPGARIVGLHNYWFGLEDYDYLSLLVPLWWGDAHNEPRPVPFDEALERTAPQYVLVDARIRAYFAIAQPPDENPARFFDWLRRHDGELVGRVDDATYGLMEIYHVR